ncbi:MAG: radical SAM protein [Butyrivibrio sp.]|nr:radical SAM protein [Muribaculum sp.]MCM1553587.1 radical SAM protein [Butyrivibrio sp.]
MSEIMELLRDCCLCPRECHVNRLAGQVGRCGQTGALMAARASLHFWEEPCISGTNGSGTVFFSGCNLGCVFCQNYHIAQGSTEKIIPISRLSEIFLELQAKGAHNINLVTPTHFIPQLVQALITAKDHGLTIPIVYNTGSYEKVDSLRLLDGLVDIYLPDLKYYSSELSARYSNAPDYFPVATAAIAEMYRQVGVPKFAPKPSSANPLLLQRGVIVRHLLLPEQVRDSKKILRYLHDTYGDNIYISIMSQYTPLPQVSSFPELNRSVTAEEYDRLLLFAERIGVRNGFRQEGSAAEESFIPEFDGQGL